VPDCWCCPQKLHPFLIVICVYAVNRLYVEKGTEKFLGVVLHKLHPVFCLIAICAMKLTVYMFRMKKK
jgi:hypothetical protein